MIDFLKILLNVFCGHTWCVTNDTLFRFVYLRHDTLCIKNEFKKCKLDDIRYIIHRPILIFRKKDSD